MSKLAYFAICANNNISFARVLRDSIEKVSPGSKFYLFIADTKKEDEFYSNLDFEVVWTGNIGMKNFYDMAFRYNLVEFNTSVKPYCFEYLFEKGYEDLIYLDTDIILLNPLTHITEALDKGYEAVVTPHITAPLEDGLLPNDFTIMTTGMYNLGYIAFKNTKSSRLITQWWGRKMIKDCRTALDEGIFQDQKYMDFVPAFSDNAYVLRHLGYNIAYWNLLHRKVENIDGVWHAGGQPIHFIHFSGVNPSDKTEFSRHQTRYNVNNIGQLRELFENYCKLALDAGFVNYRAVAYGFNHMSDGTPICQAMRNVYSRVVEPSQRNAREVFECDFGIYLRETTSLPVMQILPLSEIMYEVWNSRKDLKIVFDVYTLSGRRSYYEWYIATAKREHQVPEQLITPALEKYTQFRDDLEAANIVLGQKALPLPTTESTEHSVSNGNLIGRFFARSRATLSRQAPWLADAYRKVLPYSVRHSIGKSLESSKFELLDVFATELPSNFKSTKPIHNVDWSAPRGAGVFGFLKTESGVGEAARRIYAALNTVNFPTSAHSISTGGHFKDGINVIDDVENPTSKYRINIFQLNADNHQRIKSLVNPTNLENRYRIGIWAWELAKFPDAWDAAFDEVDEIWALSEFNAHGIRQKTDLPVVVVPPPIPEPMPQEFDRSYFGLPKSRFVFLSTFDLNSYIQRKNPEATYRAFRLAFPKPTKTGPILLFKIHGKSASNEAAANFLELVSKDSDVMIINEVYSQSEINSLQYVCDAFVSLHRSEGFGLNIAECMLKAKPVIVTNYSGNCDFVDSDSGCVVEYGMTPVNEGEYPYGENQWWAAPNIDEAAEFMLKLKKDSKFAQEIGLAGQKRVKEQLSLAVVGKFMADHMDQIAKDNNK